MLQQTCFTSLNTSKKLKKFARAKDPDTVMMKAFAHLSKSNIAAFQARIFFRLLGQRNRRSVCDDVGVTKSVEFCCDGNRLADQSQRGVPDR